LVFSLFRNEHQIDDYGHVGGDSYRKEASVSIAIGRDQHSVVVLGVVRKWNRKLNAGFFEGVIFYAALRAVGDSDEYAPAARKRLACAVEDVELKESFIRGSLGFA